MEVEEVAGPSEEDSEAERAAVSSGSYLVVVVILAALIRDPISTALRR